MSEIFVTQTSVAGSSEKASSRPIGARRSHDPHDGLVIQRGQGHWVWDVQGRRYIDFVGGYSALNLGHSHPKIVEAVHDQLRQLAFCTGGQSPWRVELEETLSKIALCAHFSSGPKVWLSTTGARAVEIAWKVAHANRPGQIVRFDLGYHGRSLATAHLSDTARSDAWPLIAKEAVCQQRTFASNQSAQKSQWIVPFPKCGSNCQGDSCACDTSLRVMTDLLEQHASSISAVIIEPAIGARGYHFAKPDFFRRLSNLVQRYGVLLISDEVQMGLGRLGAMIVAHQDGWKPDLIVLGKSLGGGITPISAVIGDGALMDRLSQGIESETFAANPLACRVAMTVLSELNDERFLSRVCRVGDNFRERLTTMLPRALKVDGRGLATVVDVSHVTEDGSRVAWNWVASMRDHGLLVHLTGREHDRVAIIPPLNVSEETLIEAMEILSSFWNNLRDKSTC